MGKGFTHMSQSLVHELLEKEKNFDEKFLKKEISEKGWNSFYKGLIDLFSIEKSDFNEENISSFLESFSILSFFEGVKFTI